MRNVLAAVVGAVLALAIGRHPAAAAGLPAAVGQCVQTTIAKIGTRLEGTPGSGSAVDLANGGYQVSYDTVAAIARSRPGDRVTMCLVSVPQGCPPGDDRGRIYKTTNLRTHASWMLSDSEHSCGGA